MKGIREGEVGREREMWTGHLAEYSYLKRAHREARAVSIRTTPHSQSHLTPVPAARAYLLPPAGGGVIPRKGFYLSTWENDAVVKISKREVCAVRGQQV